MAEPKIPVRIVSGRFRGQVHLKPRSEAEADLASGFAIPVEEKAVAPAPETPEAPDYSGWSKDELVEAAEARGLDVQRADGEDGAPLKADYLRALRG